MRPQRLFELLACAQVVELGEGTRTLGRAPSAAGQRWWRAFNLIARGYKHVAVRELGDSQLEVANGQAESLALKRPLWRARSALRWPLAVPITPALEAFTDRAIAVRVATASIDCVLRPADSLMQSGLRWR